MFFVPIMFPHSDAYPRSSKNLLVCEGEVKNFSEIV